MAGRVEHHDKPVLPVRLTLGSRRAGPTEERLRLIEVVDVEVHMHLHRHLGGRPRRRPVAPDLADGEQHPGERHVCAGLVHLGDLAAAGCLV